MEKLKVLGDDLFDDPTEDDLLTDSEAEEATRSLQRLLDDNSAKPIPIPSHKRSPVVKYHEEGKSIFVLRSKLSEYFLLFEKQQGKIMNLNQQFPHSFNVRGHLLLLGDKNLAKRCQCRAFFREGRKQNQFSILFFSVILIVPL